MTLALQESVRHRVEHVVLFTVRLDDQAFSVLDVSKLLQEHGVRLSLFHDATAGGTDVLGGLALGTGGLVERLVGERDAALVVARLAGFVTRSPR